MLAPFETFGGFHFTGLVLTFSFLTHPQQWEISQPEKLKCFLPIEISELSPRGWKMPMILYILLCIYSRSQRSNYACPCTELRYWTIHKLESEEKNIQLAFLDIPLFRSKKFVLNKKITLQKLKSDKDMGFLEDTYLKIYPLLKHFAGKLLISEEWGSWWLWGLQA